MPEVTRASAALALIGGLGPQPAAQAQLVLEEVVVVANKVESNLMETAAAVSAFESTTREELGIENAADISARTPSLTIAPSRISIRGVGRPNIALGSDPGVGLYWDGVYSTENDLFSMSSFLDIDRVEVLRGPQGTLYGRNSIGGAVNFISKQPGKEWEGQFVAQAGNYESYILQGLVSGPVTDNLSILAALSHIERQEGFQTNVDTGAEYDKEENSYGTFALRHDTTDRWTNSLKLVARDASTTPENPYVLTDFDSPLIQEVFDQDTGEQLNFAGIYPGNSFVNMNQNMTRVNPASLDEGEVSIDRDPDVKNERESLSFISEYDADSISIKYTFGYSEFDYESDYDADGIRAEDSGIDWSQLLLSGIPISLLTGYTITPSDLSRPFYQQTDFMSHELQFTSDFEGGLNFIAGLYYYNSDEKQGLAFIGHNEELIDTYRFLGSFINGAVNDDGDLYRGESELKTTSYAAYGQLKWDLSNATALTFGLRYSYDEKKASDNTFAQWVGDPSDPTIYRNAKDDWSQPTWKIGIDHFVSDDHFLYGFVATGYRSGGYNLASPTDTTDVETVDPEELLSFEIGYKGSLWDQRLNLTTAAYFYDYQDIQVRKDDVINGVLLSVYENAAEAEAWGLEAELVALLTEGLTLSGAYSYNKSEYKDFTSADGNACAIGPLAEGRSLDPLCTEEQDLSGNSFPLAPEHSFSANLVYTWEMANLNWRVTGSYLYTDEQYLTAFNREDYDVLDSWDRWDARFSVGSSALTWEVTAFVKNITDDREEILRDRPSTVTQQTVSSLSDPRTYGLRFTYNFYVWTEALVYQRLFSTSARPNKTTDRKMPA